MDVKVTPSLMKYVDECKFPFITDITDYEKVAKIGQGTFGEVFKARHRQTGRIVALKKILMENEKEGFPITALREIKMLQRLKDRNITELLDICGSKGTQFNRGRSTFYLVFTFCEHDLAGLLSNRQIHLKLSEMKCLLKQMFEGLHKIHYSNILHRDMKAANVLITKDGVLKLADFGLARPLVLKKAPHQPDPCYTNRVVTLWYRPPELLLGERQYTTAIDVWGAGCIMTELWTRSPIMQGDTEQKQLSLICQLCGSITPEVWPGCEKLPLWGKIEQPLGNRRRVQERLAAYIQNNYAVNLVDQLLCLDPSKRPSADGALNHSFFWSDPMPATDLKRVLGGLEKSMFEFTVPRQHGSHKQQTTTGHGPHAKNPPTGNQLVHDRVF